jgi:hypothetical protein
LADAKTSADQLATELRKNGTAFLNFPVADRAMTVECRELLRPFNKAIRDATQFYVGHLQAEAKKAESPPVRECAQRYLSSRQAGTLRRAARIPHGRAWRVGTPTPSGQSPVLSTSAITQLSFRTLEDEEKGHVKYS